MRPLVESEAESALRSQQQNLFAVARRPLPSLDTDVVQGLSADDVAWVKAGSSSESRARLGVYRYAYFSRLVECFTDDYPVLMGFLGSAFEPLCLQYIEQFPPVGPDLNAYTSKFPAFIRERSEPWVSFAADLAELEWALVVAVHEKAYEPLDEAALARVATGAAPLIVNPSLQLLASQYPVGEFYQAAMDRNAAAIDSEEDLDASPFTTREPLVLPAPRASVTAVCRRGSTVWRVNVVPALLPVLEQLRERAALADALNAVLGDEESGALSAESVQQAFATWVSSGFFVDDATLG